MFYPLYPFREKAAPWSRLDPNIETMDFSGYVIPTIDNTSFAVYRNLTRLSLKSCSMTSVKNRTFDSLWRLEFVSLNHNNIIEFPVEFGLASKSLNTLSLFNAFDLSSVPLLNNLTKLTKLALGENLWKKFDLRKLPQSLVSLNLNFALKQRIPPNFTCCLPNLQIIHLWDNRIRKFPAEIINNLNLTSINLRQNLLTDIPQPIFYPFLESLQLKGNKLTSLPDFFNISLRELSLSNNPLRCDQALCWLRMRPWLFDTTILKDTPKCASPDTLAGTPLMEVDPVVKQCYRGRLSI